MPGPAKFHCAAASSRDLCSGLRAASRGAAQHSTSWVLLNILFCFIVINGWYCDFDEMHLRHATIYDDCDYDNDCMIYAMSLMGALIHISLLVISARAYNPSVYVLSRIIPLLRRRLEARAWSEATTSPRSHNNITINGH